MTRIAIVSSKDRCGIQTYSATLADAIRSLGHAVDYVGIGWWDSRALIRESGRLPRDVRVVIVEHEFALYRNAALAFAMLRLRLAGKRVILSLHELEPDKFWNYHKIVAAIHYRMRGSPLAELFRILWATLSMTQRMLRYRLTLWLLGAFPHRIVFHSPRARENAGLVTGDERKIVDVPHFVEPLPGVADPATCADDEALVAWKRALRRKHGLPEDRAIFISPGFFFRRKRLTDVIDALPEGALLVLSGTESPWDEGYLDEVRRHAAGPAGSTQGRDDVRIVTDYDAMPELLVAADAVVLFYERAFQSGIASHAIWAEQPLIATDDPAFRMYEGAAVFVRDVAGLRRAMTDMQRADVRAPLVRRARELKGELSPEAMARRYLDGLAA